MLIICIGSLQIFVVLGESLYAWELAALIPGFSGARARQDNESWHARNLVKLLDLLALVRVDVDEYVAILEFL